MSWRLAALLGLVGLWRAAEGCFGQGGSSGAAADPNISSGGQAAFIARSCPDLVLYQRNERDGIERYTYEFSETVPRNGNLHPPGSTVTVRCKESGVDARVFVYDKSSTYIADSPQIVATCNANSRRFEINRAALDQVYCGQRPPFNSQNFAG